MRPGFVGAIFLAVALVLGAALYLRRALGPTAMPPAVLETAVDSPAGAKPMPRGATLPLPAPAVAAAKLPTPEERELAIEAEIERLQRWSMNDDPVSFDKIVADLTSPDKEVREAAIEAAKELGNTNAIPKLKAAAETTDDLEEKIAFLTAADFLSVPPLTFDSGGLALTPEQIQADEQLRAQKMARRQARILGPSSAQGPPATPPVTPPATAP